MVYFYQIFKNATETKSAFEKQKESSISVLPIFAHFRKLMHQIFVGIIRYVPHLSIAEINNKKCIRPSMYASTALRYPSVGNKSPVVTGIAKAFISFCKKISLF